MGKHKREIASAALTAILVVAAICSAPSSAARRPVRCPAGTVPLRGVVKGNRLIGGADVRGAETVACANPKPPEDRVAREEATARIAKPSPLSDKGMRRQTRKVPPARVRQSQPFRHLLFGALRGQFRLAAFVPLREIRSGPLPPETRGGYTARGTVTSVEAEANEMPNSGGGADVTATKQVGRALSGLRALDYETAFVTRCPDPEGNVPGEYEYRHLEGAFAELDGRRESQSVEIRIKARFVGHVGEDARLKSYDLDVVFSREEKHDIVVISSGRAVQHTPTRVHRGTVHVAGIDPRSPGSLRDAAAAGRVSFGVRGPKGSDVSALTQVDKLVEAALTYPMSKADERLLQAEAFWYGENASLLMILPPCVKLEVSPDPVKVRPGESKPVRLTLRASDGLEVPSNHQLTRGNGTIAPEKVRGEPGAPASATYTAPPERHSRGEQFIGFDDEAKSKRGRSTLQVWAENPPEAPRFYDGTAGGSHVMVDGPTETWEATGLRFTKLPGYTDEAPVYEIESGLVTWHISGASGITGCSYEGAAQLPVVGPGRAAGVTFTGEGRYDGGGDYPSEAVPITVTCPGTGPLTLGWSVYPVWLDMNANGAAPFPSGRPGEILAGEASSVNGAFADTWHWSLHPVD